MSNHLNLIKFYDSLIDSKAIDQSEGGQTMRLIPNFIDVKADYTTPVGTPVKPSTLYFGSERGRRQFNGEVGNEFNTDPNINALTSRHVLTLG